MTHQPKWLQWAREIQAIAQTGLHFTTNPYDRERFEKLLGISVDIFDQHSKADSDAILTTFLAQTGYATPKVDVRGAVFKEDQILMVQEAVDGLWSLPGGFADVSDAPSEAIEREILEESGFSARVERLLGVFDRDRHPDPPFPFRIYKIFVLCRLTGGEPRLSGETTDVGFFSRDNLPPLSLGRITPGQLSFCFESKDHPELPPHID